MVVVRNSFVRRAITSLARLILGAILGLAALAMGSRAESLAVPSYFYPGPQWDQLAAASSTGGLGIINPSSGPGSSRDPNYSNQVTKSRAAGLLVLGYVYTKWGARSSTQVRNDIDRYYSWYGVDGIFLDEAATGCSREPYYAQLNTYIKSKGGKGIMVINPGTSTQECYIDAADIIVNFEGVYRDYLKWSSTWETRYNPNRFWHLVYATPSMVEAQLAINLAKSRGANWIYATDLKLPNPWGALATYWVQEVAAAKTASGITPSPSTLPFGTIDQPAPGQTISGRDFVNFGWVLTPQPNIIPLDGSTITVYIDNVAAGHPVYNNFRSDIATLFPGLQNSNGSVGYFHINTTKLSNGVHNIAWVVTDSAGNAQRVGSRAFFVQN